MIKSLIKLASYLDINGYIAEANNVDGLIKKYSEWSESELDEIEFKSVSDGEHRELVEVWCPSYKRGGGQRLITPNADMLDTPALTLTVSVRVRDNNPNTSDNSNNCGTLAFFIRKGRYTPVKNEFNGFRMASSKERNLVASNATHPQTLMAGNPDVFWMVVAKEIDRSFNGEFKFRTSLDKLRQRSLNEEVWWTCVDCSSSPKAAPPEPNEKPRESKAGLPEDEPESELEDDRSIRDLYRWHLEQSEEE